MDELAIALCDLTEAISKVAPDTLHHGALGGAFGYGAKFENDVFVMDHDGYEMDCTCPDDLDPERDQDHHADCPFSVPNFRHKASGFSVWWYKYIGRGMDTKNEPLTNWRAIFDECVASVEVA